MRAAAKLPIRVRLTLWYAGLLATIVAALGGFLVVQLRADLRQAIDNEARVNSVAMIHAFDDDNQGDDDDTAADTAEETEDLVDAARASLPPSSGAQLLDRDGTVLAHFGPVAGVRPLLTPGQRTAALRADVLSRTVRLGPEDEEYRLRATAFHGHGEQRLLIVALDMESVEEAVSRVLLLLVIAGPVVLAATALAAYWLAGKALRPVERMTSDAREIGVRDLHERVAVPEARDEIRRLAVTLNAMLARIERGVLDRHRLVADASHELRTPLAVMRAEIDVSLRGDDISEAAREVLHSAREEVDRMSRTVDNLLALAEVDEEGLELLAVPVDLDHQLQAAAERLGLLATSRQVRIAIEGGHCRAQADPQRIALAVTNLLENAIKYTPPGGSVRLSSWRRAGEVGVTVTDEGPGISADDRDHLFDRYYRADGTRADGLGGSGLGLAICREIALAHRGRIWVDSDVGVGSSFSVALPSWRSLAAEGDMPTDRPAPDLPSQQRTADPTDEDVVRPDPGRGR